MNSSNKKKLTIKCKNCGSYLLSRDLNKHLERAGDSTTPDQKQKPSAHRVSLESNMELKCMPSSYFDSKFQIVQPGRGMVLRRDEQKREKFFSVDLKGWEKRCSAFVNQETLSQLGGRPRDCVLNEANGEVFVLWPTSEVPQMCINIDNSLETAQCNSDNLVGLSLVQPYMIVRAGRIVLQPTNLTEFSEKFTNQLRCVNHFSHFLKSYFCGGFLPEMFTVKAFYYGKQLNFKIISDEANDELQNSIEQLSINNKEDFTRIFKVCPDTNIEVDWEETEESLR